MKKPYVKLYHFIYLYIADSKPAAGQALEKLEEKNYKQSFHHTYSPASAPVNFPDAPTSDDDGPFFADDDFVPCPVQSPVVAPTAPQHSTIFPTILTTLQVISFHFLGQQNTKYVIE